MPALPQGEPAPDDGALPASAGQGASDRDFGIYLHVPFCRVRCGYCDFNTYVAAELGGGASISEYAETALGEIELAGRVLRSEELAAAGMVEREVSTVFVGGGTPTMLPPGDLARMLAAVRETWSLADGAEVTTEANPDSVDPAGLEQLSEAGFTRISFGMQSAVPQVLATLERTHDPARLPQVVRWAQEAGLEVSVDLIYGTPGESLEEWRTSVDAALALEPDHLSAYALVVEPGTKMAAQVRRGELELPSDDDAAEKYELADGLLHAAGYRWYEVSNFARAVPGDPRPGESGAPRHASRHNLSYWRGADWWGIGPGAHSHVGGVRWWNVKHPRAYAGRLGQGLSPAAGREILDAGTRELERVMLGVRLAEGLVVEGARAQALPDLVARGLAEPGPAGLDSAGGTAPDAVGACRLVLTRRGRLLADAVVRELLDA